MSIFTRDPPDEVIGSQRLHHSREDNDVKIAPNSTIRFGKLFAAAAVLLLVHPFAVSQQEMLSAAVSTVSVVKPVEHAEPEEPGCFSSKIVAMTDRPTASAGTDTTQCGVLEFVTGPERIWAGHGEHQDGIAPSVQFGLTPKLDLHYARASFFHVGGHPGPLSGEGDTFVGARYRFSGQSRFVPSFGTFYTLKVPTGNVEKGLGSGRFDHQLMFIASKDAPKVHFDFDWAPNLVGRPDAAGFDKNHLLVFSASAPLPRHVTLTGGAYGVTALNAETPSYASASLGVLWQVRPRLILDVGMDEGLTSGAPRKRIGFGFSYAPANLYALIAGPRERTR